MGSGGWRRGRIWTGEGPGGVGRSGPPWGRSGASRDRAPHMPTPRSFQRYSPPRG